MREIGIREARRNLATLIDQVEAGGEVVLLRHGRPVARLVPPAGEERRLPSLEAFRASLGSAAPGPSPDADADTETRPGNARPEKARPQKIRKEPP